jgi:transposase-like protein
LERLFREIRRRTRVVGVFPDINSCLMLATARLRWTEEKRWNKRRYCDIDLLLEDLVQKREEAKTSKQRTR